MSSPVTRRFYFSYHYTNCLLMFMHICLICVPTKFSYLLTHLLTYVRIITALMPVGTAIMAAIHRTHVAAYFTMGIISVTQTSRDGSVIHSMDSVVAAELHIVL